MLPDLGGEALPLRLDFYVPHWGLSGGIPGINLLLSHTAQIEDDSGRQICDVLLSGHILRISNIFPFCFPEYLPDGKAFFSSFFLLGI